MRIAVLGPSRHPVAEPCAGGQEAFTASLCRGLRERGHHVRLYARPGTDPALADDLRVFPELPELSAVAAVDAQLPERDFLSDHHAYAAATADLVADPDVDVVSNQSLHHMPLTMSRALWRARGIRVVTNAAHTALPMDGAGVALADGSARFVAVSEQLARLWSTIPSDRMSLVHNGIDTSRFTPGPGGDCIAWVGRITPEKGLGLAIRAARHAGATLRVAGPISNPEWYAAVIQPLLGNDIEMLGHLPHDEVARLVGHSAALLMTPRWDEPFGLAAAEALACGTPVVAIDRGGLGEVLGPPEACAGVLVPPMDSLDDEQARALGSAVRAAYGMDRAMARLRAEGALSLDAMLDRYEELLARD